MAKVHIMVGNIGTGKSTTTAKLMLDATHCNDNNMKVVSNDDLASILANGHYGPDIWDGRHISLYTTVKQNIVWETLAHGFDIIVDGTHMGKVNRKVYIDIAKKFGAEVIVYLHTYLDGLQRRIDNPKSAHYSIEVWTKVYNDFATAYEEPALTEGIDEIIKIKGK